jgi:hypothetical protein
MIPMKRVLLTLLLLLFYQTSSAEMSLPPNIKITPPDKNLPAELQALSGIWKGTWVNLSPTRASGSAYSRPGKQEAAVIVEKISHNEIIFVYVWGDSLEWMSSKGWSRRRSPIIYKDGYPGLSYTIMNSQSMYYNSKISFFLKKDGKLRGEHSAKYGLDITLRKER